MAVPEEMLVAEERELAEFAQKNRMLLSGADEVPTSTSTAGALRKLIADRGNSWMPEWLQSWRGGAPA